MRDVFISYSSYEFEQADYVRGILEHNAISCWIAPRDIPAGSNYAKEIPIAIEECRTFVLILSEKAQRSNFVIKELDLAVTKGKVIVPFMLEECSLKQEFNFLLAGHQRCKAYEDNAKALEKLIKTVKVITQPEEEPGRISETDVLGNDVEDEIVEPVKKEKVVKEPDVITETETSTNHAEKSHKKGNKKAIVAVLLIYAILAVIALSASKIEEFFEADERRHAAERAEKVSIGYAQQFLYDSEYIRQTGEEAITAARQALDEIDGEVSLVEEFSIQPYREKMYALFFFDNLISKSDADYIYKSVFNAEYAIRIHNDIIIYQREGKALLDDVDNILRVIDEMTIEQKQNLLDYFEEYLNLVAYNIALRTNMYLLPLDGKDSLKTVYDYVTEELGDCLLKEDTWNSDYDVLIQKIEDNYAQINRLAELFQNESALTEQLEAETIP